jgi:hypothetical protein
MRRLRTVALISTLALIAAAGCSPEAESPPAPVTPSPAPTGPVAPPISYACESGQAVSVSYPDTATAQLTWKAQTYALRMVQTASGARFTGSGMEWRITTRDGTEGATLSRLGPNDDVGIAVLERCSRPSSAPVAPGPVDPLRPLPGGPLPPVTPPAAPCRGPQLKLSPEGGDAGMGNRVAIIGVQNVGTQVCSLNGYPTVILQDRQGRSLTAVRSEQSPGSYLRVGQPPSPVTLAPQGKAFFDVAWNVVPDESQGQTTCPAATRIRVTAPGDTAPVSLDQAFSPCGGRVRISPFRSEAEPAPEPTAAATPAKR